MPSVIATQYLIPASAASIIESAANAGGTNTMVASAPTCLYGFFYRIENRQAQMLLTTFTWRNAPHDIRAISDHVLAHETYQFYR